MNAATQTQQPMVIVARFPGRCGSCGEGFQTGAKIAWSKGAPSMHARCAGVAALRPAPTRAPAPAPRRPAYTGIRGCSDCSRLGRMCAQCKFDNE